AGGLQLRAGEHVALERLARVEDLRGRFGHRAAGAHDVQVLVDAFARFGVVVVQAERVRVRRLQEVHDVAILMGAFGYTRAFGRTLSGRRFPAPRVRERARFRGVAGRRA